MKILAISDTHNRHNKVEIPTCDILIHAGDESFNGTEIETRNFFKWFDKQNATHLIWTPGNHSVGIEQNLPESLSWVTEESPRTNILINQEITIEGIKIWGSPISPFFCDWAWNVHRGARIKRYWDAIPAETDILITHGPPYGILDGVKMVGDYIESVGCQDLAERVLEVKPKYHIFGHVHEGFGQQTLSGTTYINASLLDENYKLVNKPVEIDYQG